MRLTDSELKRYLVKWFLAAIAGSIFLAAGAKFGSSVLLWGAVFLLGASSIGFLLNLVVFIKRKVKHETQS